MKYLKKVFKIFVLILFIKFLLFLNKALNSEEKLLKISPETQQCIGCHSIYTPGIVKDWKESLHAHVSLTAAIKKPQLERRVSAEKFPNSINPEYIVGCFECHGLNSQVHKDNFEHMGFNINVVVSPKDCGVCHFREFKEYSESKKAYAVKILLENPIYNKLVETITNISKNPPSNSTLHETCLGCHGTKIQMKGFKKIRSPIGEIKIPDLTNWPNHGVGRENPDGSLGSCSSCHPRHSFSIEIARKPYTCAQCHLDPDVPAWNVYKESKHGNIYFSKEKEWKFDSVPWVLGEDFKAPTCAVCHNSLIVSSDGEVIVERTHDFGERLWVRIFGLIYSHPQPKVGDTTLIRNKEGLPLPITFNREVAKEYLIDEVEQQKRLNQMKSLCNNCHSRDYINGHFSKFENTIKETDEMVFQATHLLTEAWDKKIANKEDPFDEYIEQLWIKQWLFYANSIRYASAMTGAPDYATFKLGWWELKHNLEHMKEIMKLRSK